MATIPFRRDLEFEYCRLERLSPLVRRIMARNPGPFTAHGTGTYVVGNGHVAIVDPGPDLAEHVDALLDALSGESVDHLLITHTHRDHSPAAAAVKAATGARTYGFGPHARSADGTTVEAGGDHSFVPDHVMKDGDTLGGRGWNLAAVHTPGHTCNHLCFALPEEGVLFSGDHVMGWSTSVIAPPDGDMAAYRASLARLLDRDDRRYWPTHGPAIDTPKPFVQAFIAHRQERSAAILARVAAGDGDIATIVDAVYAGLAPGLRAAASRSVLAHLIELVGHGKVACDGPVSLSARFRAKT